MIFDSRFNKVAVAQLIDRLAGELKGPGLIPGPGEFFHLNFF